MYCLESVGSIIANPVPLGRKNPGAAVGGWPDQLPPHEELGDVHQRGGRGARQDLSHTGT